MSLARKCGGEPPRYQEEGVSLFVGNDWSLNTDASAPAAVTFPEAVRLAAHLQLLRDAVLVVCHCASRRERPETRKQLENSEWRGEHE